MSEDPNSLMQILGLSYLCSQYLGTSHFVHKVAMAYNYQDMINDLQRGMISGVVVKFCLGQRLRLSLTVPIRPASFPFLPLLPTPFLHFFGMPLVNYSNFLNQTSITTRGIMCASKNQPP